MLTQTDLFIGGQQGYHTYRIPAMIVSARERCWRSARVAGTRAATLET